MGTSLSAKPNSSSARRAPSSSMQGLAGIWEARRGYSHSAILWASSSWYDSHHGVGSKLILGLQKRRLAGSIGTIQSCGQERSD